MDNLPDRKQSKSNSVGIIMEKSNVYKYNNPSSPTEKIDYSYSKYEGLHFISLWETNRDLVLQLDANPIDTSSERTIINPTEKLFLRWIKEIPLQHNIIEPDLHLLIKRFEVTKKIYEEYDSDFRPVDKSMYHDFYLYVLFGFILSLAYAQNNRKQYLNALLKINDIGISLLNGLDERSKSILKQCVLNERTFIKQLQIKLTQ